MRYGPPKIVISTKRRFVPIIKDFAHEIFSRYDLRFEFRVKKEFKEREDPLIHIIIYETARAILGEAVRRFLDRLLERRKRVRGFGHVRYKTIEAIRSEGMYDLESQHKVKDYEIIEIRAIKASYHIVFLDRRTGKKHHYIITKSCKLKRYWVR